MYELKIITQFGAAHQLKDTGGECENLHGHNWKIEVHVRGENLDQNGLLVDFKTIKNKTKEIIDRLDHKYLNELEWFKDMNPTSENISRLIYELLSRKINNKDIMVSRITTWESDTACATYSES
ncbi:MAG: 6-carboxytetrahydropterin synthase QueD [Deltaproteobacteria bacterium]|nr:6-carboxytetrahydropterin synthase QueD [Deltaproteobacteria bacterium]